MPSRFIVRRAARAVGMTSARPSASISTSVSVAMASISGTMRCGFSCSISARSAAPSVMSITCARCATCMAGSVGVAIDGDHLDAERCSAMITSLPSSPAPSSMTRGHTAMPGAKAASEAQMTDGLVRKVDWAGGKVTLSHGPLTHLGMPTGMTMVFRVKEAGWLDQMKTGDRIRFVADRVDGVFTVVDFVPAR
jgi:Cu(I)/Ag(I) efflux system protein CusF